MPPSPLPSSSTHRVLEPARLSWAERALLAGLAVPLGYLGWRDAALSIEQASPTLWPVSDRVRALRDGALLLVHAGGEAKHALAQATLSAPGARRIVRGFGGREVIAVIALVDANDPKCPRDR